MTRDNQRGDLWPYVLIGLFAGLVICLAVLGLSVWANREHAVSLEGIKRIQKQDIGIIWRMLDSTERRLSKNARTQPTSEPKENLASDLERALAAGHQAGEIVTYYRIEHQGVTVFYAHMSLRSIQSLWIALAPEARTDDYRLFVLAAGEVHVGKESRRDIFCWSLPELDAVYVYALRTPSLVLARKQFFRFLERKAWRKDFILGDEWSVTDLPQRFL